MADKGGIVVCKPVKLLNREIQVQSFSELFKALGKAAANGATGQWGNIGGDFVEASATLGLTLAPGQRAWLLIHRALMRAVVQLLDSNQPLLNERFGNSKDLSRELEQSFGALDELELTIDSLFFNNPKRSPLIPAFQIPLAQWLDQYLDSPEEARAIAHRLPSYFVLALHQEWRDRSQDYAEIKQHLETPFTQAESRERAWQGYRAWLQYQVEQPVFLESFGLKSVYIQPNAYFVKRPSRPNSRYAAEDWEQRGRSDSRETRVVVPLMTTLMTWVQAANRDDAVRVICGGPGCGKSSFTKMLAARLAEERPELPVLWIPLHQFDPEDDLVEAIEQFIRSDPDDILPPNPLRRESREAQVVLIFDGLDELALQGKVGAEVAQRFVREVTRTLNRFNPEGSLPRLLALLSGRELVVQGSQDEFRREGQILQMLPYCLPETERRQHRYNDPQQLLQRDQRNNWWIRYGQVTGKGYDDGMPEALQLETLDEITSQPLLNYLVALSYSRGKLTLSETSNLNSIYGDLLNDIYERDWDPGGRHPTTRGLAREDFEQILEEIALATWHGDGRTTTVSEIEKHCQESDLQGLLDTFQAGARQGVTRLLTAFYFRQQGQRGSDHTFEFTHKSFGEYLTARRIVWELRSIDQGMQRGREGSSRDRRQGLSATAALERWAKLCGPTAIDRYLLRFIRDEIRLAHEQAEQAGEASRVPAWQVMLSNLIGTMLRQGMPMERLGLSTFAAMNQQAKQAEAALLMVLDACASCANTLSNVDWPDEDAAGAWLSRLQGQRTIKGEGPVMMPVQVSITAEREVWQWRREAF